MVNESATASERRYGPATFIAAVVNTFAAGLLTWYFIPWLPLVVFAGPILLFDLAIGALLMTRAGVSGKVGRGMLIGLIAAPLTALLFLPSLLLVQAIH